MAVPAFYCGTIPSLSTLWSWISRRRYDLDGLCRTYSRVTRTLRWSYGRLVDKFSHYGYGWVPDTHLPLTLLISVLVSIWNEMWSHFYSFILAVINIFFPASRPSEKFVATSLTISWGSDILPYPSSPQACSPELGPIGIKLFFIKILTLLILAIFPFVSFAFNESHLEKLKSLNECSQCDLIFAILTKESLKTQFSIMQS